MKREEFLNKLEGFKGVEFIEIITSSDEEFSIETGSSMSGESNTWVSANLGYTCYRSLSRIGKDLYDYITKKLRLEIVNIES